MSKRALRKLLFALDSYRSGLSLISKLVWITLTFSAVGVLSFGAQTDGAAVSTLVYLPILSAAFLLGVPGGLAAGVLAGLPVVGSLLLPQTVHDGGVDQGAQVALFTGYLLLGAVAGAMFRALRGWRNDTSRLHNSALRTFAALVETYDTDTGAHCERVALNACTLGRELNLSKRQLKDLYWAGYLHDLGKVVLPSEVLRKPTKLSEVEYELIRQHPGVGARLLTGISERFEAVAQGTASHHERWDGSGYPAGLRGEDIPLFGRILAVVDVFEAATSDRPYQEACEAEAGLLILRNGAGRAFDPRLVALYEKLFWEGRLQVFGMQNGSTSGTPSRETLWDVVSTVEKQEDAVPGTQAPSLPAQLQRTDNPSIRAA